MNANKKTPQAPDSQKRDERFVSDASLEEKNSKKWVRYWDGILLDCSVAKGQAPVAPRPVRQYGFTSL